MENISFVTSEFFYSPAAFQDRFLAIGAAFMATLILQLIMFAVMRCRTGIRPLLESASDAIFSPLVTKLNRRYRTKTALIVRGGIVGLALMFIAYVILCGFGLLQRAAPNSIYDDILLLVLSLSPLWPVLTAWQYTRLTAIDKKNPVFLALARGMYSNLVHHDDHGLNRQVVKMMVIAVIYHVLLPMIVYLLMGRYMLIVYIMAYSLMNIAGRHGYGGIFTWPAKLVLWPLSIVALPLAVLILYLAGIFTGAKSLLVNIGAVFRLAGLKAIHPLEGGAALGVMALALDKTLGGPYKDRYGDGVSAGWVGSAASTAQVGRADVLRAIYVTAVTLLFILFLICGGYLATA